MLKDECELIVHRVLGEWFRERPSIMLTLPDYLSLVELLVFTLADEKPLPATETPTPVPAANIVNPGNGVFCERCNGFYPRNHMWIKHRVRTNAKIAPEGSTTDE